MLLLWHLFASDRVRGQQCPDLSLSLITTLLLAFAVKQAQDLLCHLAVAVVDDLHQKIVLLVMSALLIFHRLT